MSDRLRARAALLAHLDLASPEGGLSAAVFARLGELVQDLSALSLYPRPADEPERLAGLWETQFAHFGAPHSAGKPRVHDSTLKVHGFNKLPEYPIRVLAIRQYVAADGSRYDNIVRAVAPAGGPQGEVVTSGHWSVDAERPQRLNIGFSRVEVRPAAGAGIDELRRALGAPPEQALSADLQVAKLYSDVVYLDDEWRINVGIQGGLYVLSRISA